MKFDFCIGNPPYQQALDNTSDKPVYNEFMDAAYTVSDKVELITPGRFLFNAGKTPKAWNEKMLNDQHLKVLYFNQDGSTVFPNIDLAGGVAITYRDTSKMYGAIKQFFYFDELREIVNKVQKYILLEGNISEIMILQNRFNLSVLYEDYPRLSAIISSNGKERRMVSSSFDKLPVFSNHKTEPDNSEIKVYGVVESNKRQIRWIKSKYVEDNGNLFTWKVLVAKTNAIGFGETLSTPIVSTPLTGYTQSFIGIGAFQNFEEADACLKYIKTKFARALLGSLKVTQDNPPEKWKCIPLQNFTSSSDINWSATIADIDRQLYKKYGLSQEEINFIEAHVKEME